MAESLIRTREKCKRDRILSDLSISPRVKIINHSLFADDTLVMGGSSFIVVRRIENMVNNFMGVSRGLLNNKKCRIYGWNAPCGAIKRCLLNS